MYNIQTLNKIASCGTDVFDKAKYTVADTQANPDAIMVRSAAMHDMEFGSNLLAIARAGAGVNNIPVEKCAEQGICVFNTPGANANAVKELVIAGLLLSSRKLADALAWVPSLKNEGDQVGKLVEKGKSQFAGPEIQGKTLGIIGLGAIGILVANAAVSLGMKVVGTDPFLSVNAALKLSRKVSVVPSQKEVFECCDYLTIHVPFNADTKGFINGEAISTMKDGVRILNFARGELVDTPSILSALESGKVSCYVTDFPSAEVIGAKNVVALPHLGASTPESEDNCAVEFYLRHNRIYLFCAQVRTFDTEGAACKESNAKRYHYQPECRYHQNCKDGKRNRNKVAVFICDTELIIHTPAEYITDPSKNFFHNTTESFSVLVVCEIIKVLRCFLLGCTSLCYGTGDETAGLQGT